MTSATIRKNIAEKVLSALNSPKEMQLNKLEGGQSRPQLLILKDLNFINNTIKDLAAANALPTTQKELKLINKSTGNPTKLHESKLKEAKGIAEEAQLRFFKSNKVFPGASPSVDNTAAGLWLSENRPADYSLILANEAFLIVSFEALRKVKKDIVKLFFDETHKNYNEILAGVDRGHGGLDDTRRTGLAKSAVESASSFAVAEEELRKRGLDIPAFQNDFEKYMDDAIADVANIDIKGQLQIVKSVYVDYKKVVGKDGKVLAEYIPVIEFQSRVQNREIDNELEKRAKAVVRKFFENLEVTSLESSSTTEEQVFAHVIQKFTVSLKDAEIELILDPKLNPKKVKPKIKGSSGNVKNSKRTRGTAKVTKAVAFSGSRPTKSKRTKAQGDSPVRLMALINAKLPQTVAGNMGEPRLVNRTGRFAGSARVTDISATRQGYPSIGYTYQSDPYGVFEKSSGTRFASADRDPRTLIDASIREIATQLIAGRFYTRRI